MPRRFNSKNVTKTGRKKHQQNNQTMPPCQKKQPKPKNLTPKQNPMKLDDVMGDSGVSWVPVLSLSHLCFLIRCLHCMCPLVSWTYLAGGIGVVGGGFRDLEEVVLLISAADI